MNTNVDFYSIDNKIYLVLNEIKKDDNTYVLLANEMNNTDVLIRKLFNNSLLTLDNKDEYLDIITEFVK